MVIYYQKHLIYRFFRGRPRLLIVLDACRFDTLIENLHILNGFKLSVKKVLSAGSCTREWLKKTFTKPLDVVYITANPWVRLVFPDKSPFKEIVDLSARFWDEKLGTVRAEYVNLVALRYILRGENLIVHYLQPHPPLITKTWLLDGDSPPHAAGLKIYRMAARNKIAREEFRRVYTENLRYILRCAKMLIEAALKHGYRVVITSDHSELIGVY